MIGLDSYSRQVFIYLDPVLIYISLWIDCLFEIRKIAVFPLAFIAGWLQGHWWGFISRNYVVWPTFLMNVFIALKGSHFWFLFKYLGVIISNEGSNPEILSMIAQTTAALSKLKIIWRDKNISLVSKAKLMRTLILSTFRYVCESWTVTAELERRIQALAMRCYRRLLNHMTN